MADYLLELVLSSIPGFVAGIVVGLVAGALAAKLGASNMVAGCVGIAAFLATVVGVNVWEIRRRSRPPHSS